MKPHTGNLPDLCEQTGASQEALQQRELAAAEREAQREEAMHQNLSTLNINVVGTLSDGTVNITTQNINYGLVAMMYQNGQLQVSDEGMRDAVQRMCDRISGVVNDFGKEVGLEANRQLH